MSPQVVSIPYGEQELRFEVPDSHPLAVLIPHFDREAASLPPYQNVESEIRRALDEPIGSPPLSQFVREALAQHRDTSRVVILVDDLTRPTPQGAILPILLDELKRGGIGDEQVTLLIALGTHRPMTAG